MIKIIFITFALTLALCVTGLVLSNQSTEYRCLEFMVNPSEPGPVPTQRIEVQLENVLVPINLGNRQNLALLDVSMFTPERKRTNFLADQLSRNQKSNHQKIQCEGGLLYANKRLSMSFKMVERRFGQLPSLPWVTCL
ncbi:flagellar biosynthesis sigma factor [Vibrio chagasii]|nr:flagellar biosynthesis sigma factor [Vibrio chagasii]